MNRWSIEKVKAWYEQLPWLVGCNFTPSNAINQLEMWQAETFDPDTIDRELGWAKDIGLNCMRVFLHDLVWLTDASGFRERIERYLSIADRHGIRTMLVFFDDCWNADPKPGKQPDPIPGVHNSGWMQSPGAAVVNGDPANWSRLEDYVKDIMTTFGNDSRVVVWDLYNEPGNSKQGNQSMPLLREVFSWAREVDASQPLTAGVWMLQLKELTEFQLKASDVVTFHHYWGAESLKEWIDQFAEEGRPQICTEWLRRPKSTVEEYLPIFRDRQVGAINWGLVMGKTQTHYPWMSPKGAPEPDPWFHELLRPDGSPYREEEIALILEHTAAAATGK